MPKNFWTVLVAEGSTVVVPMTTPESIVTVGFCAVSLKFAQIASAVLEKRSSALSCFMSAVNLIKLSLICAK